MITAIDMAALRRVAHDEASPTVEVSRAWLRDVLGALSGQPFAGVDLIDAPAVRQARILAAIDGIVPGATA
ncbi:hypothetical protein BH10PSE14_BH10PSE14_04510 [soil metagenome]